MTPAEVVANLRVFNDWRRGELDDLSMPDPREIGEAIDTAVELIERLEAAEPSMAWPWRRWAALQMHQTKMREPERMIVCDIPTYGELLHPPLPATGTPSKTRRRLK